MSQNEILPPSAFKTLGFACVYLPADNVHASAAWYAQVFQLRPAPMTPLKEDMSHAILRCEDPLFGLFLVRRQSKATEDKPKERFCLLVTDVFLCCERIKASGGRIVSAPLDRGACGTKAKFMDPSDNLVEIVQSDNLEKAQAGAALASPGAVSQSPLQNRVDVVFIPVSDMARSVAWYSKLFGFQPGPLAHDGKIYDVPMTGGVHLCLDAHPVPLKTSSQPLCSFPTDDLRATRDFLLKNAVPLVMDLQDAGSVCFLTFRDPDGNLLMAMQHRNR